MRERDSVIRTLEKGSITEPKPEAAPRFRTLAIVLFIAAQTCAMGWFIRGSYYQRDDWYVFNRVEEFGLSWRLLTLDVYQHFAPINRLMHWIVQSASPGGYLLGASVILAWLVITLASVAAICKLVGASTMRTMVVLWCVGSTIFMVHAAIWWGAAVHVIPAMAVSSLSVLFFLLWHQRHGIGWLVASQLTYAAALLTQERPILLLGYLALFYYLVLRRTVWRRILPEFISNWWVWLPYLVIAVGYLVIFLGNYYGQLPRPTLVTAGLFIVVATCRFATGLLGLRFAPVVGWGNLPPGGMNPPVAPGTTLIFQLLAVLVLAAVVFGTVIQNRKNARPWVFFGICLAVNMVMLAYGRVGLYGIRAVADNTQYYADLTIPLALAIAALDLSILPSRANTLNSRLPTFVKSAARPAVRVTSVVLVVVFSVLSAQGLVRENGSVETARAWVERVEEQIPAGAGALPFTIIGWDVPDMVAPPFIAPYNRMDSILSVLAPGSWSADGSTDRRFLDEVGNLVPVQARELVRVDLKNPAQSSQVQTPDVERRQDPSRGLCVTSRGDALVQWKLPDSVSGSSLVAEWAFSTSEQRISMPGSASGGASTYDVVPLALRPDQGTAVRSLGTTTADSVFLARLTVGETCFSAIRVVEPVVTMAGGECRGLNPVVGYSAEPVRCASPWDPLR